MNARLASLVAILILIVAACSNGASVTSPSVPPGTGPAVDLTIYGAASLKSALETAKAAYTSSHPGTTLTISTDASSTLETQIEQGAPADVFLSADTANPKKLVDRMLAAAAPVTFARNKLTVIVPTSNPRSIMSPADLARSGVKVIAAGDAVPITKYATALVANLAKEAGYPANYVAGYTANTVSREDNVKAVVAKIELGEGDAAIVYVTDATSSAKVRTIDVPESANVIATYNGVVLKASKHAPAASDFLAWFAGPAGQAILGKLGFLPPS